MYKRNNTFTSCKYNLIINTTEVQKAIAYFFSETSTNEFYKSQNEKIQKY